DKNDLLFAFFAVASLLWASSWCTEGGRMPLLLAMLAMVMAVGTKPNAAALALGLLPFCIARIVRVRRTISIRDAALTLAAAALALLLLGGASYKLHAGGDAAPGASRDALFAYGDWQNLWQVPYLMLTVPFSRRANAVWVPWRGEYWFWPRYEIYFSHYGPLFTILVALLPLAIIASRRNPERAGERRIAGIAAVVSMVVMLPVVLRPVGFFGAFPRYFGYVVPLVVCWTVPPFFLRVRERAHAARITALALAVLIVFFAAHAVEYAVNDTFAPLKYVRWMREHPGRRDIAFNRNRAASVIDRVAGPYDGIAIDGAFETWSYPAWGEHLTRRVIFLPPDATPDTIPPDVQWVAIDRSWNALWGNPGFTDMGKLWRFIGRGKATPEDLRLYELLKRDPRFRLLFRDEQANQAVFLRRGARPSPPPSAP
ncbi:MAG TPA: hypothetical protein VF698_16220, partial [Thermoanaerobaculia bacterium]